MDKGDGGHQDHGGVDEPGAVHRDEDVDEFVMEEAAEDGAARKMGGAVARGEFIECLGGGERRAGEFFEARLHQGRVQIHDVGHYRSAQHGDGGVDAVVKILR